MNKDRLNAYTDAITAIILTIMVLEFHVPAHPTWAALSHLIQPMLAYLVTFYILWVSWYSQHELFKNIETITYQLYWYTGISILLMSFMPFATAWIGQDLMSFVPELFYFILSILTFINYHLFMEPEALKHTPLDQRPPVHNSRLINTIRWISGAFDLLLIWFFPPISLIVMVIFSLLHVAEHTHLLQRWGGREFPSPNKNEVEKSKNVATND